MSRPLGSLNRKTLVLIERQRVASAQASFTGAQNRIREFESIAEEMNAKYCEERTRREQLERELAIARSYDPAN